MPVVKMNCDRRLHRFLLLDKELTKHGSPFSLKITTDGTGANFLNVTLPGQPTIKIKSDAVFTPPKSGLIIKDADAATQIECDPNDEKSRLIELGTELSTNHKISVVFVFGKDTVSTIAAGGGKDKDYIILKDAAGTFFAAESDEPKIPPNTGSDALIAADHNGKKQYEDQK